jgi:Flp pilus assembly protein TadD
MLRWHIKPPRHDEAAGYCRAALAVRPDSPGAWVGLGATLRLPNHVDEAIAAFRHAIALQPEYAEPHHRLGRALLMKRAWAEAAASFREAIRLKPDAAIVHEDLGRALRSAGDLPGAVDAFRQAVSLEPNDVDHWAPLVTAYLALGDRSAHRQLCADMVSRFAQTTDPHVAAGVVCNCVSTPDLLEDPNALVQLGSLAVRTKHGLPILGAALYRAGDYKGAVFRLEHANSGKSMPTAPRGQRRYKPSYCAAKRRT